MLYVMPVVGELHRDATFGLKPLVCSRLSRTLSHIYAIATFRSRRRVENLERVETDACVSAYVSDASRTVNPTVFRTGLQAHSLLITQVGKSSFSMKCLYNYYVTRY